MWKFHTLICKVLLLWGSTVLNFTTLPDTMHASSRGTCDTPMDNKKYYVGILFSVIDQSFNRFTHLFCTLLTKQWQLTGDMTVLTPVI